LAGPYGHDEATAPGVESSAERKLSLRANFKLIAAHYLVGGAGTIFPPSYQEYATEHLPCPICGKDVVRLYLLAPGKGDGHIAYHDGRLMLVFRHPNDEEPAPKAGAGGDIIDPSVPAEVELRSCRVACKIGDLPISDIGLLIRMLREMKTGGELVENRQGLLERR